MQAASKNLLSIINKPQQFVIPIYQRTYSWEKGQCEQLLNDIQSTAQTEKGHFIGSVVYCQPDVQPMSGVPKYTVIDGQQRLTTIALIIAALVKFLEQNPATETEIGTTCQKLKNYYLFNSEEKDELYYKLLLTRRDQETLEYLLTDKPLLGEKSTRMLNNFKYFCKKITTENANTIYKGLQKLIIVDIALEDDKDDIQLIFESLNSTGLNLSQADLIRNHILMVKDTDIQKRFYERYWYPMEQGFGNNIDALPRFILDYLTMKQASTPKIEDVYSTFKIFARSQGGLDIENTENLIKELYRYSQFYVRFALFKETDPALLSIFEAKKGLKMNTSYPFILAVYSDYDNGAITIDEFKEILNITKNYVFRRAICGIPTSNLNKAFAGLYREIKEAAYLESVKAAFLLMDTYKKFPDDSEFKTALETNKIYKVESRKYLLESIENHGRKEPVHAENYTIEHILPQNKAVSVEWQNELGEDWENTKEKYLHTLGNLTLTAYNSELSDKPFLDKKEVTGGFNDSPLFLNKSVQIADRWNKQAILNRASVLAERACNIWASPVVSSERLDSYKKPTTLRGNASYNLEHYQHLQGDMLALYTEFAQRTCSLDDSVRIEFKKLYIAFKARTNFVDIEPQRKRLRLSLNTQINRIQDPRGLCRDISKIGTWGNGDVEVSLESLDNLDYVMGLIEQVLTEQTEIQLI